MEHDELLAVCSELEPISFLEIEGGALGDEAGMLPATGPQSLPLGPRPSKMNPRLSSG